ncbi:MAG: ATP-binding cassette domain-containing protein, partial [Sulfurimicrobium sp.]|nr:ATP-binding cassette domain-containing protein [Sulfurimicrobium sp.]
MTADNLVEFQNVSFSYGKRPILKGISMAVPRGKVVAIMGGSGCGKTTMLRLIGGQIRPSVGAVAVDGQRVHELDADGLYQMRRRMGM